MCICLYFLRFLFAFGHVSMKSFLRQSKFVVSDKGLGLEECQLLSLQFNWPIISARMEAHWQFPSEAGRQASREVSRRLPLVGCSEER